MNRLSFDQEKALIDFFRNNPSLWDTSMKEYNNRVVRSQKLEEIAQILNLNRKDVYEKYRNLRTTFFREHKRVTNSHKDVSTGQSSSLYVSKWRHYQNMLFLSQVEKVRNAQRGVPSSGQPNGGSATTTRQNGFVLHNQDSASVEGNKPVINSHEHLQQSMETTSSVNELDATTSSHQQQQQQQQQIQQMHQQHIPANSMVQAFMSSNGTVINATQLADIVAHGGDDSVIVMAPDQKVNGVGTGAATILTNNGAVGLVNSRILSATRTDLSHLVTSSTASSLRSNSIVTSLSSDLTQSQPLAAHPTVIYANQPHSVNGGGNVNSHSAVTTATAIQDLQHLSPTAANNFSIATPMFTAIQLPSGTALNLNQSHLSSLSGTSPLTVSVATSNSTISANSSGSTVNSGLDSIVNSPLSGKRPLQSTPISGLSSSRSRKIRRISSSSNILSTNKELENSTATSSQLDQSSVSAVLFSSSSGVTGSSLSNCNSSAHHLEHSLQSAVAVATKSSHPPQAESVNIPPGTKILDYNEIRDVIKNVVQDAIMEYEDEEMAFCRSLAASLRHVDRTKKDLVKLELQQVIVRHTTGCSDTANIITGQSCAQQQQATANSIQHTTQQAHTVTESAVDMHRRMSVTNDNVGNSVSVANVMPSAVITVASSMPATTATSGSIESVVITTTSTAYDHANGTNGTVTFANTSRNNNGIVSPVNTVSTITNNNFDKTIVIQQLQQPQQQKLQHHQPSQANGQAEHQHQVIVAETNGPSPTKLPPSRSPNNHRTPVQTATSLEVSSGLGGDPGGQSQSTGTIRMITNRQSPQKP